MPLHIGSDGTLTVTGLYAEDTGLYLNAATVTWSLTKDGTSVATGSLSYVAASDGNYTGTIDGLTVTDTLTEGAIYTIIVTAVEGGYNKKWRREVSAEYES